ncbi:hypothetical protein GNI_136890 [Gregarina niphandrodes]|uniref:Uncharacterized protein n=1 Tax=Gregarina niphandrodes TaxID=110365 RepID=A0A023B0R4_GRENI|nr:hypothetical protein GNI_136890 [Gregarina niphandrodes]EZG45742.1 hypothetical protein GNI_136890 [Gregarina niphandrodes]|eukprot:XP_011132448.1 hypothetical protein GNI_136890 [Gregarina niphandrodes]
MRGSVMRGSVMRGSVMRGSEAEQCRVALGVMVAGLSLLRALLDGGGSMDCENDQVSVRGYAFLLTGPTDWKSTERELRDSVIPQQGLYGFSWSWAYDILLNDWDHMIPYVVKQEWERQGGCRTVATLARIAAKIGPGQIPTMSYYECSSEDHTERIAFTEEVFETVFRRHYQIWSDQFGFDQFAREFKEALFLSMRDLFIDRQMDESAMAETSHGQKILSWQELRCRLLCRLCEHIRTWGQCSSHMDGHRDRHTHRIPPGLSSWVRAMRCSRQRDFDSVENRLSWMKYGDLISRMRGGGYGCGSREDYWVGKVWANGVTHLPCYSIRLYGPVGSDVHLGSRAFESRDAPKRHEMIMEYFEAQGNKLKPCIMEVDEIVDEIATVGLIPDSDKLLVTQMVIDYLLKDWTPPSNTPSVVVCSEVQPIRRAESRGPASAKDKLRRHIRDATTAAKSEVLKSGVVPDDISELGVPFRISRKSPAPPLPLCTLMWAYDVLKYDLFHVLPVRYIRSVKRVPSVVELAGYAASKLPCRGQPTYPLHSYPPVLYNNTQEVTNFRAWADDAIARRLRLRRMQRRRLYLPSNREVWSAIKTKWADNLLEECWDKASVLGTEEELVSESVFFATVYSHVCEVLRSE